MKTRAAALFFLFLSLCAVTFAATGSWLAKVPAKDRARMNPLAGDPEAVEAGRRIFLQRCASCHGENAGGIGRRPSLHSMRVHAATDGELQWLLRNGSLGQGMPAWSNLPEIQRWQLVRYLHTLALQDETTEIPRGPEH